VSTTTHTFEVKATQKKKAHEICGEVLRLDDQGVWVRLELDYITDGGATPCNEIRFYRWDELDNAQRDPERE
jgi:hypothetical protein